MSYCRWISSDETGRPSDVYVYQDVGGGWTTLTRNPWTRHNDATKAGCADRLSAMKVSGLAVPQYVIDDLRAGY
jgi:hypothetical protein